MLARVLEEIFKCLSEKGVYVKRITITKEVCDVILRGHPLEEWWDIEVVIPKMNTRDFYRIRESVISHLYDVFGHSVMRKYQVWFSYE